MYEPINAVVIMGVAGSGKSAVARALEVRSGARLIEGDAFHPDRNIQKMSSGQPLTDKDRASWLRALEKRLHRAKVDGEHPILTCSALKRSYRDGLRHAMPGVGFAYLKLSPPPLPSGWPGVMATSCRAACWTASSPTWKNRWTSH